MNITTLTTTELPQAEELWDYSFEKKDTDFFKWYFSEYVMPENIWGCFEEGKLASMLCLNPYFISLNGNAVSTDYIVGVTTASFARGKGSFRPLVTNALRHMIASGRFIALLKPISAKLYQPYGFAYCYSHLKYRLPLAELAVFKRDREITLCEVTLPSIDFVKLICFTVGVLDGYNGYVQRDTLTWHNILKAHELEGGHIMFAYKGDELCGVMLYQLTDTEFVISELLTCCAAAKNTLLNIAYQHRTQVKMLNWRTFVDDLAYLKLDLRLTENYFPQLMPFMMARIISVRGALDILSVAQNDLLKGFSFNIADSLLEENNQAFAISSTSNTHVNMDIAAFTQLYTGAYSALELYKAGYLSIDNTDKLVLLDKAFPKKINYINEEF